MQNYKELRVWQHSMTLAEQVYRHTQNFPPEERYGLTAQARRAAASIPANIAEGWGRNSTKEYLNFLGIARGSLMELETHLLLANRLAMLPAETLESLLAEIEAVSKMLSALKTSLRRKLTS